MSNLIDLNCTQLLMPDLKQGEINAGLMMNEFGMPDYWLIVLPDEPDLANHESQLKWAESLNADLPDKREAIFIKINAPQVSYKELYWLKEKHSDYFDLAWLQRSDGVQIFDLAKFHYDALAVRRIPAVFQ